MTDSLHVFANEVTEWIIAKDPQDAVKIWEDTTGEKYDPDCGEFIQEADDHEFIMVDDEEDTPVPPSARIEQDPKGGRRIMANNRAWIDFKGRGWLASTEY